MRRKRGAGRAVWRSRIGGTPQQLRRLVTNYVECTAALRYANTQMVPDTHVGRIGKPVQRRSSLIPVLPPQL